MFSILPSVFQDVLLRNPLSPLLAQVCQETRPHGSPDYGGPDNRHPRRRHAFSFFLGFCLSRDSASRYVLLWTWLRSSRVVLYRCCTTTLPFPWLIETETYTKSEFEGAKNEFEGAKNEFEGAKSEFEDAKNEFEGAKNEFEGAKNEFEGAKKNLKMRKTILNCKKRI